ncbi:MAG: N-6 DNA methylase, partial [Nanoarchaeota archaeon]|nr:N-6 DNA methylase [Nanoarchaeota archaeon]
MINEDEIKKEIASLLKRYNSLPNKDEESEKKAEEFISELFKKLGWDWLSAEVTPQKKIKSAVKTTRVDYSFKKEGDIRPSFYFEVKRFSDALQNPEHISQAIGYGKNSGTRWVVLTNFIKWRVFNSDYFDEPIHAELFEFDLNDCLTNPESINWLLLFSRENGGFDLDEYAKKHKKWKESADIEDLLTEQLLITRKKLGIAIKEQNLPKFDTGQNMEEAIDACVQTILDRIIFCRMLEDNGGDQERKMVDVLERWKNGDNRVQFYKDFLCPFFLKMHDKYDSTIFDQDRIDRLSIKNEDFIQVLESFYVHPKTKLRYRFDAMNTDILGHAYENYLSYKVSSKKKGLEEEMYKRKQSGIYYTPEFLVNYLVKSTLGELLKKCKVSKDALKIRVLDPACGSGTFLVRAFEEFKAWFMQREKEGKEKELLQSQLDFNSETGISNFLSRVLENCIYGIDLDPRAVRLTRLNLFLRALDTPKQLPRLNIIEKNSLVWDGDDPKAFNIEREFPLVAESGGFDVVLGNPPWEKWKPDSQEFFEQFEPGFKSLSTQEAKKRMEEILKTRPLIKKLWIEKQANYELYSTIFRKNYKWQSCNVNGKMVSGDLDLYKIFTERAHMLVKNEGIVGFVIPSGIYTDLGAKGLRTMLFDNCAIKAMYSFEN